MEGVDLGVAGALAEGEAASPATTSQRIRVVRCQLRGGGWRARTRLSLRAHHLVVLRTWVRPT